MLLDMDPSPRVQPDPKATEIEFENGNWSEISATRSEKWSGIATDEPNHLPLPHSPMTPTESRSPTLELVEVIGVREVAIEAAIKVETEIGDRRLLRHLLSRLNPSLNTLLEAETLPENLDALETGFRLENMIEVELMNGEAKRDDERLGRPN